MKNTRFGFHFPPFTTFMLLFQSCQKALGEPTLERQAPSGTTSINDFRNCTNTNSTASTGNTVAVINALFNSY